jgi:hypothetical protein
MLLDKGRLGDSVLGYNFFFRYDLAELIRGICLVLAGILCLEVIEHDESFLEPLLHGFGIIGLMESEMIR